MLFSRFSASVPRMSSGRFMIEMQNEIRGWRSIAVRRASGAFAAPGPQGRSSHSPKLA